MWPKRWNAEICKISLAYNASNPWSEKRSAVATLLRYRVTKTRTISNAFTHVTASCLADTIVGSRAGPVCKTTITVLAASHAADYLQLVRTAVIIHVMTAYPVLPAIGSVTHVASIADAPRSVAIRVSLAQSDVDGVAIIDAITAVCRVRFHVISFLAIFAAKRN
jgi:hypothetical protein